MRKTTRIPVPSMRSKVGLFLDILFAPALVRSGRGSDLFRPRLLWLLGSTPWPPRRGAPPRAEHREAGSDPECSCLCSRESPEGSGRGQMGGCCKGCRQDWESERERPDGQTGEHGPTEAPQWGRGRFFRLTLATSRMQSSSFMENAALRPPVANFDPSKTILYKTMYQTDGMKQF